MTNSNDDNSVQEQQLRAAFGALAASEASRYHGDAHARIYQRAMRMMSRRKWLLLAMALTAGLAAGALAGVALGRTLDGALLFIMACACAPVLYFGRRALFGSSPQLETLKTSQAELLATQLRADREKLRIGRHNPVVLAILPLFNLGLAARHGEPLTVTQWIAWSILAAVFWGMAAYSHFVSFPTLRREIELLEEYLREEV